MRNCCCASLQTILQCALVAVDTAAPKLLNFAAKFHFCQNSFVCDSECYTRFLIPLSSMYYVCNSGFCNFGRFRSSKGDMGWDQELVFWMQQSAQGRRKGRWGPGLSLTVGWCDFVSSVGLISKGSSSNKVPPCIWGKFSSSRSRCPSLFVVRI